MSSSARRAEKAREWEERQRVEQEEWQKRYDDLYFVPEPAKNVYLELEDAATPAVAKAVLELWEALQGNEP